MNCALLGTLLMIYALPSERPSTEASSTHAAHQHAQAVDRRGDAVMGFSHQNSRHAFTLLRDGGSIEVNATGENDIRTVQAIRKHLHQTVAKFAEGDFRSPQAIHGRVPPGAPAMRARKNRINYAFSNTPRGARVRILTSDAQALKGVHEFLRFQIKDHRTGDSMDWPRTDPFGIIALPPSLFGYSPEKCGAVAQFGRAPESHSGGRRFDPDQLHQFLSARKAAVFSKLTAPIPWSSRSWCRGIRVGETTRGLRGSRPQFPG